MENGTGYQNGIYPPFSLAYEACLAWSGGACGYQALLFAVGFVLDVIRLGACMFSLAAMLGIFVLIARTGIFFLASCVIYEVAWFLVYYLLFEFWKTIFYMFMGALWGLILVGVLLRLVKMNLNDEWEKDTNVGRGVGEGLIVVVLLIFVSRLLIFAEHYELSTFWATWFDHFAEDGAWASEVWR
jgi:hypothetical protein